MRAVSASVLMQAELAAAQEQTVRALRLVEWGCVGGLEGEGGGR